MPRLPTSRSARAARRVVPSGLWDRAVLDRLIESLSGAAVFMTDAQGVVTSCSPAAEQLLGHSKTDVVGRYAAEFFADGVSEGREILRKLVAAESISEYPVSVRTGEGDLVQTRLSAMILKSQDGVVAGIVGSIVDRGEFNKLARTLRNQVKYLLSLIADSADAIIELDGRNRIKAWSPGARVLFGFCEREAVGRGLSLIIPEQKRVRAILKSVSERLREDRILRETDIEALDKVGNTVHIDLIWVPMLSESGRIISKSVIIKDVTERGQPREGEFHAKRLEMVGRKAARMAHEVKNPLASICLNLDMLQSELGEISDSGAREQALELLNSVKHEFERIGSITQEYLEHFQVPQMQFEKQCLREVLMRLQGFMKKEMEMRDIKFINVLSTDVPQICFDRDRIEEAVLNLYKNSAEAMPTGGMIKTVALVSGDWVEIRISDTGSGIPDEEAGKLFEPFFTTKAMGTGLGLSIVRDILAAHSGTVEVYPNPGKGAIFLLRLPLER